MLWPPTVMGSWNCGVMGTWKSVSTHPVPLCKASSQQVQIQERNVRYLQSGF